MTLQMMNNLSSDDVNSFLHDQSRVHKVIGEGNFNVTFSRIEPGMVWIKIYLDDSDSLSFIPVITEDLRLTLNQTDRARYFLIETSLESNRAFLDFLTSILNSLTKANRQDALKEMSSTLTTYLEFFAQRKNLMLSKPRQRGLIGELFVLNEMLIEVNDSSDAINFWQGPLGRPQDFIFESNCSLEIKTKSGLENAVIIANERQLESSEKNEVFLCVFPVTENPGGYSLHDVITKCIENCSPEALPALYSRLQTLGLEKWTIPYHNHYRLFLEKPEIYRIDTQTKVITTHTIPDSTSNVRYKLNLSSFQPLTTSLKELIQSKTNYE
jgi:hypothetical protein